MRKFVIPLIVFVAIAVFLGLGLTRNPREVPSPLVGKPAPAFELSRLVGNQAVTETFSPKEMLGQVWLLNVWASWCVSCKYEHPLMVELSKSKVVPIVGLNYKDQPSDAGDWLRRYGNPYLLSAVDIDGRVAIDWGVYGAPETYVIDKQGVIRFKQVGPVTREVLDEKMLPLIKELQK
jgi:cytochrome c biogenesis protein CcmG/thiol:disulfide interchange protein DsbE